MRETVVKKTWVAPTLVEYGNIAEITLGCDKTLGLSDGFTFTGQAIVCAGPS